MMFYRLNEGKKSCNGKDWLPVNDVRSHLEQLYIEILDTIDDYYLLTLAEERLKNDNGVRYSFDEILAKNGLTFADIEAMDDVEIE
jgi:hypothetical protein